MEIITRTVISQLNLALKLFVNFSAHNTVKINYLVLLMIVLGQVQDVKIVYLQKVLTDIYAKVLLLMW